MSQAQAQAPQKSYGKMINTIIGVLIMVIGPFLGSPEFSFTATPRLEGMGFPIIDGMAMVTLSPAGWNAAIVFIGALWLWIMVDTFWPSILAVGLMAFSPYYPLPQVMAQYMGNPTTFMMFFLMFFTAALIRSQVVNYVANFFLTRDFLQGRPWLLMFMIFVTCYIGNWLDGFSTLFMLWPVTYLILTEAGYKPGDKVSTFMVGNLIAAMIFATLSNIVYGPVLWMSGGYTAYVTNNPQLGLPFINVGSWIAFSFIICACTTAVIFFSMRFIFRLDVEPIRNFDTEKFKQNPLPPMNWKQKTIIVLFVVFVCWMVIPSILPASIPFIAYCKSKTFAGTIFLFLALITIKRDNEPLVKLPEIVATYPWGMFFLLASAFYFGGVLTNPATNIPIFLELVISNLLQGLSYIPFILAMMLFALIATNLMNSIVTGIIVAPIIATVALNYGFNVLPIVCLFFFVLMSAVLTPAAGVPGALLYGNKEWLPGKSVVFYAVFFTIAMSLVTLVVGIPLAQIMF